MHERKEHSEEIQSTDILPEMSLHKKPSLPADIKTGIAPLALIARNGTYIKQPAFYSSFRNGGVTTMEDQNGSMA